MLNALAVPTAVALPNQPPHQDIIVKVLAYAEDVVRAGRHLEIRSTTFGPDEMVTDEVAETVRRGVAEVRR